jgi:adenylylsulfate kinase
VKTEHADGLTVWFTGLSSAGKSTICEALFARLQSLHPRVEWLDGDAIRQNLSRGLGFSKPDRDENIRRIGFVAELLTRHGVIVLVSAISPYRAAREEVRSRIGRFVEVYVNAPLSVCEQRDLKGIYRRARLGEIQALRESTIPMKLRWRRMSSAVLMSKPSRRAWNAFSRS